MSPDVSLHDGRILRVINVHLKSKIASNVAGQKIDNYTWRSPAAWAEGSFVSAMKRMAQAVQLRVFVDSCFDADPKALIVVTGDFNATPTDVPVLALCGHVEYTGNPDHAQRVLVACENNIPASSRYSLIHHGKGEMIDHVLASRSLIAHFNGAEIHNEHLPDESGAFRDDTKFPESDHAPVVAEFNLDLA